MLTWIFAAVILYTVQVFLVSTLRYKESGLSNDEMMKIGLGSRDNAPSLQVRGQRADRALTNMKESLPIFLAFAVLAIALGKAEGAATTAAMVFVLARVVYVPLYLQGVYMYRSVVWTIAALALVVMAFALI